MNEFIEVPATKMSLSKRRLVRGVGINDCNYLVTLKASGKVVARCPYYSVWRSMLTRCYDPKHHARTPTYTECSVIKEWLTFSTFKSWMKRQNWAGRQLDKDILTPGNKIYGPIFCMFVPARVNTLLNTREKSRGNYPLGVSYHPTRRYQSNCRDINGDKQIEYWDTEYQAQVAYSKVKIKLIIDIADGLSDSEDKRLKPALINWCGAFEV